MAIPRWYQGKEFVRVDKVARSSNAFAAIHLYIIERASNRDEPDQFTRFRVELKWSGGYSLGAISPRTYPSAAAATQAGLQLLLRLYLDDARLAGLRRQIERQVQQPSLL